jgi:hypothetical protein
MLNVLSAREASIFACLCDTVVAPEPPLPPVAATDAVAAFDRLLAAGPPANRAGLRALLLAVELAPRLLGAGGRLRRLPRERRTELLERAATARSAQVRQLAAVLRGLASLTYFGDDGVMRALGYRADERVAAGRAVRERDGRP